jgi:hypothetical protein
MCKVFIVNKLLEGLELADRRRATYGILTELPKVLLGHGFLELLS